MGEFFSHQTLSSIILIALRLQNCAQKNNLSPNAEITGFRVHVNCRLLKSVFFFFFYQIVIVSSILYGQHC